VQLKIHDNNIIKWIKTLDKPEFIVYSVYYRLLISRAD